MKTASKKRPQQTIDFALRQLILDGTVGTHEEICAELSKMGYSVNQPKISRLLHKIGAVKVINDRGENIYRLAHEHGLMHEAMRPSVKFPVNQLILNIDHNDMMIVIHTLPGSADLVARELDLHQLKLQILGTIAGDDTIFIAPKEQKRIKQIVEGIKNIFSS